MTALPNVLDLVCPLRQPLQVFWKTDACYRRKIYDTDWGCPCPLSLLYFASHQERIGQPVLPTGDGEILRWLKGECSSMCSGEKSAEHKISPRLHRRFLIGIGGFCCPGFWCANSHTTMNAPQIAIRIGGNPNHHLWNNNGTWWLHYTEHLPDYTKRRVRRSLRTQSVLAARSIRDTQLSAVK